MQLSEYDLRYILGLVLVVCIIRYFIYSWSLSIAKESTLDTKHDSPLGNAKSARQENEQFINIDSIETKQMYWKWALITVLLVMAGALLFIGS